MTRVSDAERLFRTEVVWLNEACANALASRRMAAPAPATRALFAESAAA